MGWSGALSWEFVFGMLTSCGLIGLCFVFTVGLGCALVWGLVQSTDFWDSIEWFCGYSGRQVMALGSILKVGCGVSELGGILLLDAALCCV